MKATTAVAVVLGFALAALSACSHNIDNKEAVRQGVVNYLAKRSDFLAMDVSVTSVAFRQDEATATVHFQAKGNTTAAAGMNMQYVLERKGGQWVVKGRAGGDGHGGAPQNPASGSLGAMPNTGTGSIGAMPNLGSGTPQTLPPGHPSVPGGATPSGALPPGHPAVNPQQSSGNSK